MWKLPLGWLYAGGKVKDMVWIGCYKLRQRAIALIHLFINQPYFVFQRTRGGLSKSVCECVRASTRARGCISQGTVPEEHCNTDAWAI